MNERLKQLALEAYTKDCQKSDPQWEMNPMAEYLMKDLEGFLEQFALSILKEYENFLPEICPWAQADQKGPMMGWHVMFVARKHFGVE